MPAAREELFATIPMSWVGPLKISGNVFNGEVQVPLATYETPLWPSVGRGAKISRLVEAGISTTLVDERMSRSILLQAPSAIEAFELVQQLDSLLPQFQEVVSRGSRFAKLIEVNSEIAGNLMFLRFEFKTGDASGHNMVTAASDQLMVFILEKFPKLSYGSVSGNYCSDKKATAVNGILGRGKNVIAELVIPEEIVHSRLRSTAEKIATLNTQKNFVGSILAGSLRSANAHFANMLLGFYLATGQDAANIVEGSQGVSYAENRSGDLYFSCTLPNLIVGTVGNGKGLPFVAENLAKLGCAEEAEPGENARKLAVICAATVLCGELSLLAAQTNPGELMKAHFDFERKTN